MFWKLLDFFVGKINLKYFYSCASLRKCLWLTIFIIILVLQNILDYKMLGNEGLDYLNALGVFLALALIFYLIQKIFLNKFKKRSEQTKTDFDDFLLRVFQNIKPPFYIIFSLYIATKFLILSDIAGKIIYGIFIIAVVAQVILVVQKVIDFAVQKRATSLDGEGKDEASIMQLISQIVKFALWVFGALLILSNLGVNVTSLVAGFGIGGLAVALAAQSLLGDVFASFSIFIDKPFRVGDSIRTGEDSGRVQKIGVKTTRIKTLAGNELSIPNKELTDSRIHNLKRIGRRRNLFSFGVTYNTGSEKLKRIPEIIKDIVDGIEGIEFSRAHFKSFGASSLDFEVVYFVDVSGYKKFMNIRQEVNLKIYDQFEKEGIEFAYPTQTLFLNKE